MTNTLKWLGAYFNSRCRVQFTQYLPRKAVMCLRGVIWVIVGYMWREYSIIITNLVLTLVSLIGMSIKMGFFS